MCPTSLVQKMVPGPGYCGLQLVITQQVKKLENMSDGKENTDTRHSCDDEQQLEKEIEKEIHKHKLKYFLDEMDEIIKVRDYTEMDIANRRAEKIVGKLSDLLSQVEELKIDHGVSA